MRENWMFIFNSLASKLSEIDNTRKNVYADIRFLSSMLIDRRRLPPPHPRRRRSKNKRFRRK